MPLRLASMIGIRAVLRLNDRRAANPAAESRHSPAPAEQWTLWAPIALVAITALVYQGFSISLGPSGCFLLLAAIQSYFVVWCMVVGAVPVGFRWLHSESEPFAFSIAAIAFLVIALGLGIAAILTGPA